MTIEELGRRAVACKAWQWVAGAMESEKCRIVESTGDGYCRLLLFDGTIEMRPNAADLSDRATLALLRDIVAQAHGGTQVVTMATQEMGCVSVYVRVLDRRGGHVWHATYATHCTDHVAEALVRALEAAP